MPTVDVPQLGTIVITAIVSAVIGYFVHWLQTRQERKWQQQEQERSIERLRLEEKQKAMVQYVERQQLVFERLADISGRYKIMEMSKNDLRSEFIPIAQELAYLSAQSVRLYLPEDAELMRLNQKLGEETESLKEFAGSLEDTPIDDDIEQKMVGILKEKTQTFAKIGKLIDQRFEELKAQIK